MMKLYKKIFIFIFFILKLKNIFNSCCLSPVNYASVKTVFIPISQGQNLYTQYHKPILLSENKECEFDLSFTYRFSQSQNSNCIAKSLFEYNPLLFIGNNAVENEDRPINALIPEYFGMGANTNTLLNVSPTIQNNIYDLQLAINFERLWFQVNAPIIRTNWKIINNDTLYPSVGLNNLENNQSLSIQSPDESLDLLYLLKVNNVYENNNGLMPLDGNDTDLTYINNYINNNSDIVENIDSLNPYSGFTPYNYENTQKLELGYWEAPSYGMNLTSTLNPVLENDSNLTISSLKIPAANSIYSALSGYTFGSLSSRKYNLFNVQDYGNLNNIKLGFADIILQCGYDFIKTYKKHFGFYLRGIIPTGTKLNNEWAKYVFNSIIGNGHHFEFGGGISGHISLWNYEDENEDFAVYLDGYFTHVFPTSTFRSFDLLEYPMSRYAIIKQLNMDYSFNGNLFALGDINSTNLNISCTFRGECIVNFVYSGCSWQFGVGYALSGLTQELKSDCACNDNINNYLYGFKGNTGMSFFGLYTPIGISSINSPIEIIVDPKVENAAQFLAGYSNNVSSNGNAYIYGIDSSPDETNTFYLPNFNSCSGLMGGQFLNRIFGHFDYTFANICFEPEIGVVGSIGFGSGIYLTAQYWDIGFRFGFRY